MTDQNAAHQHTHANPVQVEKFLKGVDYPCRKEDLINKARQEGADENVIETLQEIPGGEFNSPKDVAQAIGEIE